MPHIINLLDYSRVEIGCAYLKQIVDYIAEKKLDINLIFISKKSQLIITDPQLIDILDLLNIPYKECLPQNTLKFVMK